jgi:hypothetical protein
MINELDIVQIQIFVLLSITKSDWLLGLEEEFDIFVFCKLDDKINIEDLQIVVQKDQEGKWWETTARIILMLNFQ